MITSEPKNWQDLQNKVDFILKGTGLNSNKEVTLDTPRGSVEIDVFAIDENSVDKIKYIIECKNWNKNIPQSVVHSFTTVMNETGGNIGYIISKKGFQTGAEEYTKYTNISLYTYKQFQKHYFKNWFSNYFAKEISNYSQYLISYTEPLNSFRDKFEKKLNKSKTQSNSNLINDYSAFANWLLVISLSKPMKKVFSIYPNTPSIEEIKKAVSITIGVKLNSNNYHDILIELKLNIETATNKFIGLYGKNIFLIENNI